MNEIEETITVPGFGTPKDEQLALKWVKKNATAVVEAMMFCPCGKEENHEPHYNYVDYEGFYFCTGLGMR